MPRLDWHPGPCYHFVPKELLAIVNAFYLGEKAFKKGKVKPSGMERDCAKEIVIVMERFTGPWTGEAYD